MPISARKNRAMPESPKIVAKVAEAAKITRETGEPVQLFIPWSDFVFSNVPLPPSSKIRKALESLRAEKREWPVGDLATTKGVFLTVRFEKTLERFEDALGTMRPDFVMSMAADAYDPLEFEPTIRHELLHFTQFVGENLILYADGKEAFTSNATKKKLYEDLVKVAKKFEREGGERPVVKMPPYRYGRSKSRSVSKKLVIEADDYSLSDHEFMTLAFDVGFTASELIALQFATKKKPFTELIVLAALFHGYGPILIRNFSPTRKRDFYFAAYSVAAKELNKKYARKLPLEESLGQAVLKGKISEGELSKMGIRWTAPALQKKRDVVEGATRRAETERRKRERRLRFHTAKRVQVAEPSVKKKSVQKAPSTSIKKGLHYRQQSDAGKRVFSIYDGDKPTGKYFFSEEKAEAFVRRKTA